MSRTTTRVGAAVLAASLVALAAPASAHVSVSSDDATQGGFGIATFSVPNESDTAATTKIEITLPTDAPFAFVSAEAKPGWTVEATTKRLDEPVTNGEFEVTEATSTITWTATGDGIAPGEYDTFGLSGGPFPTADELMLPTVQTYDDGEIAAWDQEQTGDTEPEMPAPVLALSAASGDGEDSATSATTSPETEAVSSSTSDSDGISLTIAIAAAVVAVAALLVSVRQNRRRA
ncbi:YcnI family copper-binding membrane protein [Aeromicrobium sp. CF3.5]|uniref:YcnI family copper-binding membrane protein n=1 Tax=Aeromicrobium sp. CF3.5 TaxID=3373078 RepID=UPI003EE6EC27